MNNTELAALRRSYALQTLSPEDLATDPTEQFQRWFGEAVSSQILEPNAMVLATVNAQNQPLARTVLLKEMDAKGFVFYTNYESQKAQDLAANPHATLLFVWLPLERQIRISGRVEQVDRATSQAYYESRPRGSQIGAWASPQSRVIPDRTVLEAAVERLQQQYGDDQTIPLPPHWGGYRVIPDQIEFWQGRQNRLHDRMRYTRQPDGSWLLERLAP
jgi:pyridoxamine 5'-phosphate oxidase